MVTFRFGTILAENYSENATISEHPENTELIEFIQSTMKELIIKPENEVEVSSSNFEISSTFAEIRIDGHFEVRALVNIWYNGRSWRRRYLRTF